MSESTFNWALYGRHTPMFSWAGQTKVARLVAVHDSDTCRVVFQTPDGVKQFIVRVYGIDGPELMSQDLEEKRHGILARNKFLEVIAPSLFQTHGEYDQKLITDKLATHVTLVRLDLGAFDKYGRLLAKVSTIDGIDVGQRLIESKAVHAYYGKTKEPWHFND